MHARDSVSLWRRFWAFIIFSISRLVALPLFQRLTRVQLRCSIEQIYMNL